MNSSSRSSDDRDQEYLDSSKNEEEDSPNEFDIFIAVSTCVMQILRDEECTYMYPLRMLKGWLLRDYTKHFRPHGEGNGDGDQSFCSVVWLAYSVLQSADRDDRGNTRLLSNAAAWKLSDKHVTNYGALRAWKRADENALMHSVLSTPHNKQYTQLLDRLTRTAYLNMLWDECVCVGERVMAVHKAYNCDNGSGGVVGKLERMLATYLRDYDMHEDSDSKFVANGRDIVTRVLCETGSSLLFVARRPLNVESVDQVRPVDALLAFWDDVKLRDPKRAKIESEDIYKQLCTSPGDMKCKAKVLGGWLLHVFSLMMHTAETEHKSAYVSTGSDKLKRKMRRRRRMPSANTGSKNDTSAAFTGSHVHKSDFMRNHVITNYDWGHPQKTGYEKLSEHSFRRPLILQFRDHWFVVDYMAARVLDCGPDNKQKGTGCILALYTWTKLMRETEWFNEKLAVGSPIPQKILECV